MKKTILYFTMALSFSFSAHAHNDLTAAEDVKVVLRLFQNSFAFSCSVIPQVAVCDQNLADQVQVTDLVNFDEATLAMTTMPSVHSEMTARNLSQKFGFDYNVALKSVSTLEAFAKRIQAREFQTSRLEFEAVYFSAMGVQLTEISQLAKSQDQKNSDQIADAIAQKFKTNSRDAKLFLEGSLAK